MLEVAYRWLLEHRPARHADVVVHGDFRLGNFVVGEDGLRAVLDWESAHLASPFEDLGWLCVPAWRFGGEGPVGGFGTIDDLLAGYSEGGGAQDLTADEIHWAVVPARGSGRSGACSRPSDIAAAARGPWILQPSVGVWSRTRPICSN